MDIVWIIVQFVIALGLLIFFHELGHFLASKALGIPVLEFGFGYPPRMVKLFTWKGTDVTLNWIPFGGFIKAQGETDDKVAGGMASAPAWKRLIIMLSGPLMNFIVGIIVLIVMYVSIGIPASNQVLITDISANSPAQVAQLQSGDIILKVNDTEVQGIENVQALIKEQSGKEITMQILRGEETLSVNLVPRVNPPEGEGAVGIGLSNPLKPMPFFTAVGYSFETAYLQGKETVMLPVNLIKGTVPASNARIVGFKGIFDIYNQAGEMDNQASVTTAQPLPVFRLSVIAMVSIAFGITNLLPIPMLDGGQILFLLPELLFKKAIPRKIVNTVNSVFFMLLILLMVYITIQDFVNPIFKP
jgi:regulator of sigma E protease